MPNRISIAIDFIGIAASVGAVRMIYVWFYNKRWKCDVQIRVGVFSHIAPVNLTSDKGLIGTKKEKWKRRQEIFFKNGVTSVPVDVIKLPPHPEYVEVVDRKGRIIARSLYVE